MIKLSNRSSVVKLSSIREIFEMASKMPELVRLEVGQPDFGTPQHIIESVNEFLSDGHVDYTESAGILEARQAVAKRLFEDYGTTYDPESEIIITSGASTAIYTLLRSIINPCDRVLYPTPGWSQYGAVITDADGVPVEYLLDAKQNFAIDMDFLENEINKGIKAIIINSPSNPVGVMFSEEQMQQVLNLVENTDAIIIFDQAYDKIIYNRKHIDFSKLVGGRERVITIGSASKNYAMCGWRLGYAVGSPQIINQMMIFQSLTTLCPSMISQWAAIAAFGGTQEPTEQMRKEYLRRRDYFIPALNNIPGIKATMADGAFYTLVNIEPFGMSDWDFTRYLINEGLVTCIPGSSFGSAGEKYVRMAFANSMGNLELAIERITEVLRRIS